MSELDSSQNIYNLKIGDDDEWVTNLLCSDIENAFCREGG